MSAAGLIRRRSLAQPGVATRHTRKHFKPEVRRAETAVTMDSCQLWKPEMMGTSPLARLSSLDNLEPDLLSPLAIAENRAHTPTGDEYSNLGNLKRGSLMITNGAASPAPSFISQEDFVGRRHSEDEYFTASENGSVPASPTNALLALPPQSANNLTRSRVPTPEVSQAPDHDDRSVALLAKRSGSPLKREIRAESPIWESDRETDFLMTRKPRSQPSALSLVAKSENHSLFSNVSSEEDFRAQNPHQRTVSQSALSLAAEYMLELPPSHHNSAPRSSQQTPGWQADLSPSRLDTARKDSVTPSPVEQHESWEPSEMPCFGQTQIGDEILAHTALRSHPPNITVPMKSAPKSKHSSQAKPDSGYCSSVSTGVEASQILEMNQPNLSIVNSVAVLLPSNVASMPALETEQATSSLATPVPRSGASRPSERWSDSYTLEGGNLPETPDGSKRTQPERSKSWRKSARRSFSRLRSAENTPNNDSPLSMPDIDISHKSLGPKKLQKRRPLSQPPLAICDSHNISGEVPQVPSPVFSRFSERLATSPGLQHLEHTYEDASTTNPRRGSASPRPASGSSPVVPSSYFPDAEQNIAQVNCTSKHVNLDSALPKPSTYRHGFSRMSFRRSSAIKKEEEDFGSEDITGVSDFGTVAQSLGSGPYDIVRSVQRQRPYSAVSGTVKYPHQFGSNQQHFEPREGWDAETASKFAQMRSRERAAAAAATERKPLPKQRPPISNRPKSFHEQSPIQHPERPSMYQRPKSVHGSVIQGQGRAQHRFSVQEHGSAQLEYQRPSTSSAVASTPRPRTANDEGLMVYDHAPRSASPIKNMVRLFEARAAPTTPTPSPRPPQPPTVDWSEQSRIWRERKTNAQEGIRTTSSDYGESVTTTTTSTMATYAADSPLQPGYPTMQTSYSSTPSTTTRTMHSSAPITATYTSYLSTPVSTSKTTSTSTMSVTSQSRISQTPRYSQVSTPRLPKSREQPSSSHAQSMPRHEVSPTPEPSPNPTQQQQRPASSRMSSGGILRRFSGGLTREKAGNKQPTTSVKRRDITPRTQSIRSGYGIDFGDIPTRNRPI